MPPLLPPQFDLVSAAKGFANIVARVYGFPTPFSPMSINDIVGSRNMYDPIVSNIQRKIPGTSAPPSGTSLPPFTGPRGEEYYNVNPNIMVNPTAYSPYQQHLLNINSRVNPRFPAPFYNKVGPNLPTRPIQPPQRGSDLKKEESNVTKKNAAMRDLRLNRSRILDYLDALDNYPGVKQSNVALEPGRSMNPRQSEKKFPSGLHKKLPYFPPEGSKNIPEPENIYPLPYPKNKAGELPAPKTQPRTNVGPSAPAPRKASPAAAPVKKEKKPTLNSYIPRYERD